MGDTNKCSCGYQASSRQELIDHVLGESAEDTDRKDTQKPSSR